MEWTFKNEQEATDFLDSTNKYGSELDLGNMRMLMDFLGHPERKVPIIHIAGTNGKGSVGAYLSEMHRQCRCIAYHFSSPSVFHPRDVWKRNGLNLTTVEYIQCVSKVYAAAYKMRRFGRFVTRFETETAVALYGATHFHNDVLILEVGMGGADDATNIIERPRVTVFTDISYDHMQYLGDTLTEIATVKAGIIKPYCKVYSAQQVPEVKAVLDEKVIYGPVHYVDNSDLELISQKPGELKFKYKGEEYETSMSGLYQMKNAALAIEVAREVRMPEAAIKAGIKEAVWEGRFQVLSKEPYFIIDGAHNVAAVEQLAQTVENCFTNQKINLIIGVLKDKEHEKMMKIMVPFANRIYTITPPNDRGLDAQVLAEEIRQWHEDVICCESIEEAVVMAMDYGRENDCATLAFGSLSYLKEVKISHDNYLKKQEIL